MANTRTLVMTDEGMRPVEKGPKTASGKRSLPLPAQVTAALRTFKTLQAAERLAVGPAYEASGYVLVDEFGSPLHTNWLRRQQAYKLMATAGVRLVTPTCRWRSAPTATRPRLTWSRAGTRCVVGLAWVLGAASQAWPGEGSPAGSRSLTVSAGSGHRCLIVSGNERRHVPSGTPDHTPRVVERSGPAIKDALLAHAPERCRQFETEFRSALALAAQNLDLSGPQAVLAHWQAVAMMAANPLTDEEREKIGRAKAGDFSGLLSWDQDENGSWVRL